MYLAALSLGSFILILIFLFFVSNKLTSLVGGLIYRITHSQKITIYLLALLYFPGTLVHELAHLLTAGLLFVPVGEVELFPEIHEGKIKLGSVQIAQTDILRRSLIGMAPVFWGIILIFSLFLLLPPDNFLTSQLWLQALFVYLIFQIANTMFSSGKDMEGVVVFLAAVAVLAVLILIPVIYFWGNQLFSWLQMQNYQQTTDFMLKVDLFLLAPLIVDILAFIFLKLFVKTIFR